MTFAERPETEVLQWNKSQADAIQKVAPYEVELIIPDGHYTVESLDDGVGILYGTGSAYNMGGSSCA